MKLSQALVELYLALIKDGVLILDLTAAPDNYNAPVLKAASLMDNYTFYRFSKICELFVNGKDIEEITLIFHNTRSGNPQVDIFFRYYFEWWKKAEKIWSWRNGSFSPLARIKFRLIDKSKRLERELERAGKEGTSGMY